MQIGIKEPPATQQGEFSFYLEGLGCLTQLSGHIG